MNHIFTTEQVVKLTKDPLKIWLHVRFPGLKIFFIFFSTEKSRHPSFGWGDLSHENLEAGSLMLQSGAHVGNRDFEEAKRCAKDETAASRWNVPSEAMEKKGTQTVGWVILGG